MPDLRDVFLRHGPEYLRRFGDRILPSHRRALRDIIECRTQARGGHIAQCDTCGMVHYLYHSCTNRSCPTCQGKDRQRWIERRRKELLPVPYFHLVFTLPEELRALTRKLQRILYHLLAKAAAASLMTLAADPRYVGGRIAVLCVLHTWTRAMVYHPHLHCLVPAGALSADGASWLRAHNNFLVPARAFSKIFRAKFMAMARKALPEESFPDSVWEKDWVVDIRPSIQGADRVIDYLARYVHRVAITNNRILRVDGGMVSFRYKDSRDHQWKIMTLPAMEFIRRYLQHVLPRGFHKVRFYGLLSSTHRRLLEHVRTLLADEDPREHSEEPKNGSDEERARKSFLFQCPRCEIGWMAIIASILPRWRWPP